MKTVRMKMKFTILSASGIIGGFTIFPFHLALAIEPAPDSEKPPAALLRDFSQPDSNRALRPELAPKENVPFIGLATATLPDMVADHLDIQAGTGVIIRTVCPASPASKAGLSVNDIILHIDGAAVGNPEAITSAVLHHKVGDRIGIDLIHRGKPAKVEVTLGERPADFASLSQEPMLEGLPQGQADRLRGLIEQNLRSFGSGNRFRDRELENNFRMMREQMNHSLGDNEDLSVEPQAAGGIQFQQNSTIRMMDGEGSVEIKSSGDAAEVTVRDTSNQVSWSGPWNSEEDKAAAPDAIRKRIDRVDSGKAKGFSFRFGKLRQKSDTIDN